MTFTFPESDLFTPLLRTDASRPDRWEQLLARIDEPTSEGFLANLEVFTDEALEGLTEAEARRLPKAGHGPFFVFLADTTALASDAFPILVVDTSGEDRPSFRVVVRWLWSVQNNLSLANMDWEEFAEAVDADGVFRGH